MILNQFFFYICLAVIHESTNFIDSLLPDRPTGVIRRKKKTGATVAITSVPGATNKTGPPTSTTAKPSTPTSPHTPISPTTAIKNSLPIVPSVSYSFLSDSLFWVFFSLTVFFQCIFNWSMTVYDCTFTLYFNISPISPFNSIVHLRFTLKQ